MSKEKPPSGYKQRIADGWCGIAGCLNRLQPGQKSVCETHRQKAAEKAAAKRAKQKSAGLCVESGCKEPPVSGGRCQVHKEYQAALRKESTDKKKTAGICVATGCHAPVKDGCTLCQTHIDERSKTSSRHYQQRKAAGTCLFCGSPPESNYTLCAYHREKYKSYRAQLKIAILDAYGGPVCVRCGEDDVDILEIDHIAGGGTQHRKEVGTGYQFYLWLRDQGYPAGYRVLCPTCNKRAHVESKK